MTTVLKQFELALKDDSEILLLWGTRGAGKSVFAAHKTVKRLINEPKHKILAVRKVGQNIRHSVFQELKDEIRRMGLENDFKITVSPYRILHRPTGNEIRFIGMYGDRYERLLKEKDIMETNANGVKGITSVWIEHMDELTEIDFDTILMALFRGEQDSIQQIIGTFNTTKKDHWIHKNLFESDKYGEHLKVSKYYCTYKGNPFINEAQKKILEQHEELDGTLK